MMNRSHLENPLLAQFVGTHLQNNGQRLYNKDASDKRQEQFLLDDDGHGPNRAAESE